MSFLGHFEAVCYRGIGGISFDHLARTNLIVGGNGVGKTAVLEAMWLLTGRHNSALLWNPNVQRTSRPVLNPIAPLASGALELRGTERDAECGVRLVYESVAETNGANPAPDVGSVFGAPVVGQIKAFLDESEEPEECRSAQATTGGIVLHQGTERIAGRPNSIISVHHHQEPTTEFLKRYSDLVKSGGKERFLRAIHLVRPSVVEVEILVDESDQSYLSAVTDDGMQLRLGDLGGGAVRLAHLFVNVSAAHGGALFVDEVGNGFHHSVLRDVWAHLRQSAHQSDVQLIATTHSDECLRAAMDAYEDAPDDLAIHKIHRRDETASVEVVTYAGDSLLGARELNLEIR